MFAKPPALTRVLIAAVALLLAATLGGPTAVQPASASAAAAYNGYGVNVASFNILASTMAPGGRDRARRAARAIKESNSRIVSFQEVARDQLPVLKNRMPGYSFWPQRKFGGTGSAIQIAWQRRLYAKLDHGAIWRPFLGKKRPIPWALIRDRGTGRKFFVIAIHNAPGGHEVERDISTRKEIELIKRLQARGTVAKPVFVLGDVNEKVEFCKKVARATNLVSMSHTATENCPIPHRAGPDWIMGTNPKVDYSRWKKHYNHISDHPMLTARAWVRRTT